MFYSMGAAFFIMLFFNNVSKFEESSAFNPLVNIISLIGTNISEKTGK